MKKYHRRASFSFNIEELIVYYSLRGFTLADIMHLLDDAHGTEKGYCVFT